MAAVHDGEVNVVGTVTAGTSITLASKTSAGANRIGIVGQAATFEAGIPSGVTWDGVAMTKVVEATETVGASLYASQWRTGATPPPLAGSSVVVTFAASRTASAAASSYNGVDQSTFVSNTASMATAGATASPITVTCTTAADETVVDADSFTQFDVTPPTVGANQTEMMNATLAVVYFGLASWQLGSDGGVMSWTFTGSGHRAVTALSLLAAGGGATVAGPLLGGMLVGEGILGGRLVS
jgi:hypothetical protein